MPKSGVLVREFYNGYDPPTYARKAVEVLLASIPDNYLQGLDCVVLTNQSGQPRRRRIGKVKQRGRRFAKKHVLGSYFPAHRGGLPWIQLYVDKLVTEIPPRYAWMPLIREVAFGGVLFHEVGHHIHATLRPEFQDKEDVADEWSKKLLRRFFAKRYWYLMPVRKLIAPVLTFVVRRL